MDGITKVVQRISSIEQRFVTKGTGKSDFSTVFAGVQQQESQASFNPDQQNILKMINFAAQRYGVDPKLAVAVAQTESGLSSEVVSSAGAVGVMQLMPGTAKELGVHNINDARENIDAGVRYLKQMLGAFNGDAAKAVAAYNAGPQAVMNYNGVPPYSETKAYVAKVMSLYR